MSWIDKHLRDVQETYFVHACTALRISGILFVAGAVALIHALLPFLFTTTASDLAGFVVQTVQARRQEQLKTED